MKKNYEACLLLTLVTLLVGAFVSYVSVDKTGKHDQPLEQIAEVVVERITGLHVDFTPGD
jgi:hypothetical protein